MINFDFTKIRQFRKEAGLRLKDLAEAINISINTISRWENGSGSISVGNLLNSSRCYGNDIRTLFIDKRDRKQVGISCA